jgi:ferredoxin
MPTITFSSPQISKTVVVPPHAGNAPTLLDVARANGVPILFTCEAGGCGACLVRVEVLSSPRVAPPHCPEEAFFLRAIGKFSADGDDERGENAGYRLACLYVVGEQDILVRLSSELSTV